MSDLTALLITVASTAYWGGITVYFGVVIWREPAMRERRLPILLGSLPLAVLGLAMVGLLTVRVVTT